MGNENGEDSSAVARESKVFEVGTLATTSCSLSLLPGRDPGAEVLPGSVQEGASELATVIRLDLG